MIERNLRREIFLFIERKASDTCFSDGSVRHSAAVSTNGHSNVYVCMYVQPCVCIRISSAVLQCYHCPFTPVSAEPMKEASQHTNLTSQHTNLTSQHTNLTSQHTNLTSQHTNFFFFFCVYGPVGISSGRTAALLGLLC
jgi:hypothetical protein